MTRASNDKQKKLTLLLIHLEANRGISGIIMQVIGHLAFSMILFLTPSQDLSQGSARALLDTELSPEKYQGRRILITCDHNLLMFHLMSLLYLFNYLKS